MSPRPPPILEDSLREMFPEEWLRQTAKETGLIVRERKIDPVIIFWVLTLSFGVRLQRTLASLKREYETESRKTISDSSWYYRFTPELVEFLHQCVIHGMEELAKEPGRKLSKKLETFQDVVIQDSTIVRFHSSLADKFPAARSRTVAAGVKVGVMVSAVANGPRTVALYSEKMARYTQLRWSTIFAENASDLLTVILHRCGIQRTFETIMSVYESQALDPHVNREEFRDEWLE
ncbi:hypothetical protein [Methanosarcina barkeri]|uniref:Transposase n=1 Tax=Methanosarcina barkeri CM1 TaxID=796385 RepID=A0A0G3CFJ9_METBA|nr:hypothetical protein [Methanosarcina barkeri]AKJ37867.1 transposase [Methanosarcina barkeri CM1]